MPGIEARAPERTETSKRIGVVAEPMTSLPAHARQGRIDLLGKVGGIGFPVLVEIAADFGGDGEAGRDRQAERRHLRQIGALAAEQSLHLAAAIGLFRAEGIDPFRHQPLSRNRARFEAKASRGARRMSPPRDADAGKPAAAQTRWALRDGRPTPLVAGRRGSSKLMGSRSNGPSPWSNLRRRLARSQRRRNSRFRPRADDGRR